MSPASPEATRFREVFARSAARVRARLAVRRALGGAAVGLAMGAVAVVGAFALRQGELRPWTALGGVVGAAAGLAVARRRRPDDEEVALHLDARLGSFEAVTTAIELVRGEGAAPAFPVVLAQATRALEQASPERVRPRVTRGWHALAPLGAAVIGVMSWLPLPPLPPLAAAPGSEKLALAKVDGLDKVLRLAEITARDEAQRERLAKLATDARKLREKLQAGVEKREAQADMAKLRDGIAAERLSLGDGEQRRGLEAALGKLGDNAALKDAQKALGDRDPTELDRAMEELANRLEKADRDLAQKTLEEAAEAAKQAGAPGVAKTLEQERKRLEERAKQAEALRELAKALGDGLGEEAKESLDEMGRSGSPEAAQALADALGEALGKLSDAERKRLAENLKKQAEQAKRGGGASASDAEQLEDLADKLSTPEGRRQLAEMMKLLANLPPPSDEAGRQQALDDAQRGAEEAEAQMGGVPLPTAGGKAGGAGAGQGPAGGDGKGDSAGGPGRGGGPGRHEGQTGVVAGESVKAHASARMNAGKPMPGIVLGRGSGRAGETANVRGEGALGAVGPGEVGGVDRSDVPEEYREQVGRYFEPR